MLTDLGHEVAAIVPRLKEALAAVERETYRPGRPGRAPARRKRLSGRGSADRQGRAVRVRHRLRRARPAGDLSRAAGAAEAVRQGRSRARAQDARFRRRRCDFAIGPACRAFVSCDAAGRLCLMRPIFSHGSRRRRASRFGRFATVKAFDVFCEPSSSQVSGTETVAPGRARVE